VLFKKIAGELDISLTKNVINALYAVSRVPLETEQPLFETFFYLMLNKRVISSDQDKWDTLYSAIRYNGPTLSTTYIAISVLFD
jgi:hypothetical protein